jgi:hypothetical protein
MVVAIASLALAPISLFNGTDLSGWTMDVPELDNNPAATKPFTVRNGLLVSLGSPGGHLITEKSFKDYELVAEYRFSKQPGNCGILIHVSTPRRLYGMFPQSLEVQMQSGSAGDFWCIGEDITVPNMESRRGPKENWGVDGSKARRIARIGENIESPVGEWNTMKIVAKEKSVTVFVNGHKVNEGTGCTASQGKIAIQAEGSEVEFRKLTLAPIR